MALTLAEAKVGMADKVDQMVIDEFRRSSQLLDLLVFDDAVSPGTGGSTLVYGYQKLKTPSTAGFRGINEEYSNNEAKREKATAELKIFGGNYKLDRVIIKTAGAVDELNLQMVQKIKAASNLFHYTAINGDADANEEEFDGLDKLLKGSSTVFVSAVDISTAAKLDSNYNAFLDEVTEWLASLEEKPTSLLMNSKMLAKMKNVARRAGYYSRTEDAFGRSVDNWDNIPMLDLAKYFDGTNNVECVPINGEGETAIYAICVGLEGFHAVSPNGETGISHNEPDMNRPGVMKEGDVEAVMAVVLKNTLRAGALKGIKVLDKPDIAVDVDISEATDLLGKVVTDLQENIVIDEACKEISGDLKFISDYSSAGYIGDEKSGNFLVTHWASDNGAVIKAELVGGVHGESTLDPDGLLISRITDVKNQKIKITSTVGNKTSVAVYSLKGLNLRSS